MSSVKYVQPNSLIANINEKIDELTRKIIPTCTLKHSDQKQNVFQLIGKFKSVVTNILSQLNQNEVDYNTINFDEVNDSLEKAYKLLLDEIVLPYEKIDLTDINSRLNKLEDDLDRSIDDKRGELDELAIRVSFIEDETVDGIKEDIDTLKEEVKKNVTIPSDLNEKWNSVRDYANEVPGWMEVFDSLNSFTKDIDDAVGDRRNEIEQLQQDRDDIKEDIGGIKDNADYLENSIIESVKSDIMDANSVIDQMGTDVMKLKGDVQQLQQKVQALQASPSGGGTTQALPYPVSLVYDITSEEWTQLIFFLLSAVYYSGNINLQTFKNQCETSDGDPFDVFNQWMDVLRAEKILTGNN